MKNKKRADSKDLKSLWEWEKYKCFVKNNCRLKDTSRCNGLCDVYYKVTSSYLVNNISEKYRDWTSDNLSIDSEIVRKCVEHIDKLILDEEYTKSLYLHGSSHSGKTTLASVLLNDYFRKNVGNYTINDIFDEDYTPILFIPFFKYADAKRSRFKNDDWTNNIDLHLPKSNLIVIDDITAGNFTPTSSELLFMMIDDLINLGTSFIITDNHTPQELQSIVGTRTYNRIIENSIVIQLEGASND